MNGPWRPANCRSYFSIPVGSNIELLGASSKSTVMYHSSVQLHDSSILFCTIRQHSSALFVSTVLHYSSVQFCKIRQFSSAPFISYSSAPFVSYSSAPFVSSVLHHSSATVLHHSSVTVLHHSSVQFCTIS